MKLAANYLSKLRFNRDVWLVLITWALIGFAYTGVFLVLFNLYLLRLGYGPEFVGIVNGVGLIAMALVSLPAGALGKRWGSRRLMILGMALMTLGFALIPLVEVMPARWQAGWFIAAWCLVLFSAPFFTVNSAPYLMGVASPEDRNYAFSMQLGLFSLAGFAGGLIAGLLPGLFSEVLATPLDQPAPFRYSLVLAAVLFLIGLLVTLATREPQIEQEQGLSARAGPIPLSLISVMAVVMLLRVTGEWVPNVFFNVYLDVRLNAPPYLIGALIAIGRLIAGIAALSMPLAVKRWGKERVIGFGTLGSALCLLPLALVPHWGAAEIGFVGAIALISMVSAAFFVYGQELVSPTWQAVMSGAIWMGNGVGGAGMLIAGGYIVAAFGYSSLFLVAAALTAAGSLLFLGYFHVPRGELAHNQADTSQSA